VIYASAAIHGDRNQNTSGHLVWGGIATLAAGWGRSFHPPLNPIFLLRWLSLAAGWIRTWLCTLLLARLRMLMFLPLRQILLASYSVWHCAPGGAACTTHAADGVPDPRLVRLAHPRSAGPAGLALGLATCCQTTILIVPALPWRCSPPSRRGGLARRELPRRFSWRPSAVPAGRMVCHDLHTIPNSRTGSWGSASGKLRPPRPASGGAVIGSCVPVAPTTCWASPVAIWRALFPSWDDELMLTPSFPGGCSWRCCRSRRRCWPAGRLRSARPGAYGSWRPAPAFALLLRLWLAVPRFSSPGGAGG
jgi:hypothetical protein